MDQNIINDFLNTKSDYLFPNKVLTREEVESALRLAPDELAYSLDSIKLNNPSLIFALSFIHLDRLFLKGSVPKKIAITLLKLFTLEGFGIFWIPEVVTAKKRCRIYNCELLMDAIKDPSTVGGNIAIDGDVERMKTVAKAMAPQVKELRKAFKDFTDSL